MNIAAKYHDTEEPESQQDKVSRIREWRNVLIQVQADTEKELQEVEQKLESMTLYTVSDSDL
jgi:peptidyl-tRNA hydrolase